ncbi:MAG TPA: hypothetical protein VF789_07485 [Thermoanaerobaculia bacterium]
MHPWIGSTVAQVLALCGASYSEIQMVDEPPGKLRGVEFVCQEEGTPRRVLLEIEYHSGLFSAERSWNSKLVQDQKVVGVRASTKVEE